MSEEEEIIEIDLPAEAILRNTSLNKGLAFTKEERKMFGLNGHLPALISNIDAQIERRYLNFKEMQTDWAKYRFFKDLRERNEVLYFRLILEYPDEILPYIYTPLVGEAAQKFSTHFTHTRGIFFPFDIQEEVESIVASISQKSVKVIVITDGGRVLGLGDMGAGGMAIALGKLDLYTVFGGIHPSEVLPVTIDVGTDNPELLENKLYVGSRHHRVTGDAYYTFVDRVVSSLMKRYPNALLQWEDFSREPARRLLDRYSNKFLSFNDDIQGTSAVVLAAIMTGMKASCLSIKDEKIAILGGGAAGIGVASLIVLAKMRLGKPEADAIKDLYIVDIGGLLVDDQRGLDPKQKAFAHHLKTLQNWRVSSFDKITLKEVIENAAPYVLIGLSSQTGAFTEEIVRAMSERTKVPIILPLSNPTSKSEARPIDLLNWSKGKALIATGSPFQPVTYEGKTYQIAQCNNLFVFPGLGLGLVVSMAKRVTDDIFLVAVDALSSYAAANAKEGRLLPTIDKLRDLSKAIAIAVATHVFETNQSKGEPCEDIEEMVEKAMWYPRYPKLTRKKRV
jgi:malate dehydrogenase (oxaloacetate-decarboxylating)